VFFFLSKTVGQLTDPLMWALLLGAAGAVVLWRTSKRRAGLSLVGGGVFVLLFFSLPVVSDQLWSWMEAGAHRSYQPGVTYDAVVLLGGMTNPGGNTAETADWDDAVDRLIVTHELLATGHAQYAIVSGGRHRPDQLPEAEYLAKQLEAWGIDPSRIIVEPKARNTRENATLSKALIEQHGFHRVVIVTSAIHMPRAEGCFRAVEQPVDTLPTDRHMVNWPGVHLVPHSENLAGSSQAIHEWVGRVVYRVMGYSKER